MLSDCLKTLSHLVLLVLPFTTPAEDWAYRLQRMGEESSLLISQQVAEANVSLPQG